MTAHDPGLGSRTPEQQRIAEQREAAEEILGYMDAIAQLLEGIGDAHLNAYVLADFQGAGHGWLGTFARDHVQAFHDGLGRDDAGDCVAFEPWPDNVARVAVEFSRCRVCGVYWREHPGNVLVEWKDEPVPDDVAASQLAAYTLAEGMR